MAIEYREHGGELVWVRNPFTGAVTYFTHVHKKRSGFVRHIEDEPPSADDHQRFERQRRGEMAAAMRACPFCPGNEALTESEVLRVDAAEVFPNDKRDGWLIRAVQNIIPRIPESCTGGRNESYVVIEDPRHFIDAGGSDDLLYSGHLDLVQFQALFAADLAVARRAYSNPAVQSVLIRKNQGRESGASQPHPHNQVIGCDIPFPAVACESAVSAHDPGLWREIVDFAREFGFLIAERNGCFAYFCPFGTFPRSYDIVCLDDYVRAIDLPLERRRTFVALLFDVLQLLGPMPLDYEIHEGGDVPLHAHVNARHYAYSNIGGTLNLPSAMLKPRAK